MIYKVVCTCYTIIFKIFFRWDVRGKENIPSKGALIICSNHISWWDPPLVGCLLWPRKVSYMAKEELFKIPLFRSFLLSIKAFPVKRDSADRRAIKKSLEILKNNEVLGLFPEGTRSKTDNFLPPQPGIALIAIKSEAAVLPIAIVGPYRIFRPIRVQIGTPMNLSEYYDQKISGGQFEQIAGKIMDEVFRLRQMAKDGEQS